MVTKFHEKAKPKDEELHVRHNLSFLVKCIDICCARIEDLDRHYLQYERGKYSSKDQIKAINTENSRLVRLVNDVSRDLIFRQNYLATYQFDLAISLYIQFPSIAKDQKGVRHRLASMRKGHSGRACDAIKKLALHHSSWTCTREYLMKG